MSKQPFSNIVLTGFMATGKSTVGRLLAQILNYHFVDTDKLIENQQGTSIPEIFATVGEDGFRKLEKAVAKELATKDKLVIATGGRLMLDRENADLLSENGEVFSLIASTEEILNRLTNDTSNKRPLLSGPDQKKKILELLQKRRSGYQRFTTIDTDGKSPDKIAEEILQARREPSS